MNSTKLHWLFRGGGGQFALIRGVCFMKILGAVVLTLLVLLPAGWQSGVTATIEPGTEKVVDAGGNLRVPGDYRTAYQFLGSWAVAADQGQGSKEIHVVYASPGATAAYRKNGRFSDGSVLVKEVFEATTQGMTTGTVSHAQTLKGWFVMMKDSKDSHPGNKLWGNGWGWSWFDAANPSKTTSTDFKVDCLPCHEPARASDWIYVQGYPALKQ
jgi:cytochrome P460